MHDQIVVSVQDLRLVTISCSHCNTKVTLDLEMDFEPPRAPFHVPTECPRCGSRFDSAVPRAVEGMYKVYKALAQLGAAVTFSYDAPPTPGGH
jgi:hypothetical protein